MERDTVMKYGERVRIILGEDIDKKGVVEGFNAFMQEYIVNLDDGKTKAYKAEELGDIFRCVTKEEIEKIRDFFNSTLEGLICDADTILADLLDERFYETSGIAEELFDIWENAKDKKVVEDLFELFTGYEFDDYLKTCEENITRKADV